MCKKGQKHEDQKRQREHWLSGPVSVQGNFQGGDKGSEFRSAARKAGCTRGLGSTEVLRLNAGNDSTVQPCVERGQAEGRQK